MWKKYRKAGEQEMRPYVPSEDLSGISLSERDTPEQGGMIARNSDNHKDQWYVAKAFFEKNYTFSERTIVNEIIDEIDSANKKFGRFNSSHEGYAVIKEEVDELWHAVKVKSLGFKEQRKECIQIAAKAIRFIIDIK